jgi:hypothetical protein
VSAAREGQARPIDAGVIEVHVRELHQLFDSLDPSPFHERDLDRNFEEYVTISAKELPSKRPAALVVYVDVPAASPDEAAIPESAIREHFARRAELTRRELRQLLRRGWISLAIGLSVLAAGVFGGLAANRLEGPLGKLIGESLLIGGWVAMWRPMEILLYDWWGVRGEQRVFERLARVPVRILHAGRKSPARGPA